MFSFTLDFVKDCCASIIQGQSEIMHSDNHIKDNEQQKPQGHVSNKQYGV